MADEESTETPEVDERDLHEIVLDALNEWLGGSGMVTAFHLVGDYIDDEGDDAYFSAVADGQPQSRTLGLIAWAQKIADYEAAEFLRSVGDE